MNILVLRKDVPVLNTLLIHKLYADFLMLERLWPFTYTTAFPTGGFSHSMGTEAAFQRMFIKNKDDLKSFILCCLENVGSFSIPFVKAAYESFSDEEKLKVLDSQHNAGLLNHVSHRASKQQGRSFLSSSDEVFSSSIISHLQNLVEEEKIHGHLVIIFAVVCAALQISIFEAAQMFMFNSLRTIISSIVRLGKLGAIEAQRYQFDIQNYVDDIISRNWSLIPEKASISFPMSEVLQNSHDNLFTKLFFS